MRQAQLLLVLALAVTLGAAGCRRPAAAPLTVAAASSLQPAMAEVGTAFTARQGVPVVFSFGASLDLARQIQQGAPFDLLVAADTQTPAGLAAAGLLRPETVQTYAVGRLVLAVSQRAGATVAGLSDLRRPEVSRIAIAHPDHAPYGMAARSALQAAGLWDQLRPKIVYAETVRQALQFVQTGNAEAGLVAQSVATAPGVTALPVEPGLYPPVRHGLGVVTASARPDTATQFAAFLTSPAGQAILARHGFDPAR